MSEQMMQLVQERSRVTTNSHVAHTYIIKVWEDIGEPLDWSEELDIIDRATEHDTIVLDICSDGGILDTAMLFNRALRGTPAHTVAIIGPSAASAASVFALSCREWVLDETSSLMCHTSSYRIGGKDTDILEHANFSRKQLRNLYESVYTGFLSAEEIEDVIKGTPFYFDADQLAERLEELQKFRMSQPCDCGDENCPQNQRLASMGIDGEQEESGESFEEMHVSLQDMIENAVTNAVNKAFTKQRKAETKKKVDKPVEQA